MELFASSLLLRLTDPILEKLVSKVWLEDIGVLHDAPSPDDEGKKIEINNGHVCICHDPLKFQPHTLSWEGWIIFLNQPS